MERQEYELEAVDMGNLFHQSIDRCFACMKDRGQDWRDLTEEGRKSLVKECVTQVTEEYGNTIMSSSARNAYLAGRVERITDRTIWALAEQVKKGGNNNCKHTGAAVLTDTDSTVRNTGTDGTDDSTANGRTDDIPWHIIPKTQSSSTRLCRRVSGRRHRSHHAPGCVFN